MHKQIFSLFLAIALLSCQSATNEDITGVYTRHTADESGQLWDTLDITPVTNGSEKLYAVIKKSGTLYIRDGKDNMPVENKTVNYTATYNTGREILNIKELDLDYSVDTRQGILRTSQVSFKKVK